MTKLYLTRGALPIDYFAPSVDYLLGVQQSDGSIPWFIGGHLDPWDHVEAAMGLSIAGRYAEAVAAYEWLATNQLEDGSWWARYEAGEAVIEAESRKESNFVAYIATGVWHHYLISGDHEFLQRMWPAVKSAVEHVLELQATTGEVYWARDGEGRALPRALVTGCSSIYKSLECAYNISVELSRPQAAWKQARERLGQALRTRPDCFDQSKSRYSMDWFYPILTGVVQGEAARNRLRGRWQEFIEADLGCRCVSDEPWVTVAESCELTMALLAAGDRHRASELFSWLHEFRCDSGVYWTGYQFDLDLLWPEEQPTWTAGAVLLAADALAQATPASRLFTEVQLLDAPEDAQGAHHWERLE